MRVVAGTIYRPGQGWAEGWIAHDGERILDEGQGKPPARPEADGVVIPSPVNAHTHVGDRLARGVDIAGMTLAQVVAPPDGLKHRLLRAASDDELIQGIRNALDESLAAGVRDLIDFREGGVRGVALLREAATGLPVRVVALARCAGAWDDDEADEVLRVADGLGLSSLGDVTGDVPERAALAARRHGKRFALHLSEGRREDLARALALSPDFLVHMVHATDDDLASVGDARIPIVLCPRSNARFGPLPDVAAMVRAEIPLALGSDNAMLQDLDVLEDARLLRRRFPEVPPETWLDAATLGGAYVRDGGPPPSWLRKGDPADLVVLKPQGSAPVDAALGPLPAARALVTARVP